MTQTIEAPDYKALDKLTGLCAPLVKGRAPYWRPKAPKALSSVHTPSWAWSSHERTTTPGLLNRLDCNGAYLAAASSATFAHGELVHTGTDFDPVRPRPGIYQITRHPWSDDRLPDPLGTATTPDRIWIAHPTLVLLVTLQRDQGYALDVHDSWTAEVPCRLRKWTEAVRDDRALALDHLLRAEEGSRERELAQATYEAIKVGYSQAVQLMSTGSKSKVHRPDWYHTIHAQHAASHWRRIYRASLRGCFPAEVGSVDEMTYRVDDLLSLGDQLPFIFDQTGRQLGSYKSKGTDIIDADGVRS